MLKRLSPAEIAANLLAQYAEAIRAAFMRAAAEIKSGVVLSKMIDRLESGDIEGAVEAVNIEPAVFNPLLDAVQVAFNGGGAATIDQLPTINDPSGHQVVIRFDSRNLAAEAWLRDHSSTLVTDIVADQRKAIRTALAQGLAKGANPRQTAMDIAGRIDRATGQRTGGIIGLTSSQADWVSTYEADLRALDPNALTRVLRDKRFDRSVTAAIDSKTPLTEDKIASMVTAYQNRALRYRAEALGRTESLTALNGGADAAMQQAIASGKIAAATVTKVWHAVHDGRTRETHAVMDGQKVPMNAPFVSPSGARLQYPGDPSAPASEIVGCRCWLQHRVDFLAGLK